MNYCGGIIPLHVRFSRESAGTARATRLPDTTLLQGLGDVYVETQSIRVARSYLAYMDNARSSP